LTYAVAEILEEKEINFERLRYCSEIRIDIKNSNLTVIVAILPKFSYFFWLDYLVIYVDKLELSIKRQNLHLTESSSAPDVVMNSEMACSYYKRFTTRL
jgi:hypothetical protein